MMDPAPVDLVRLGEWMSDASVGASAVEFLGHLSGGTQNVLLRLRSAGREYVLRMPAVRDGRARL